MRPVTSAQRTRVLIGSLAVVAGAVALTCARPAGAATTPSASASAAAAWDVVPVSVTGCG